MANTTYTAEHAKALSAGLSLYTGPCSELLVDYTRARMLLAALLTDKEASDKYIKRLEAHTDRLEKLLNNLRFGEI